MKRLITVALGLLLTMMWAPAAFAQFADFTIVEDGTTNTYYFRVPISPEPDGTATNYFYLEDVPVRYNGVWQTIDYVTFYDYNNPSTGGYGGISFEEPGGNFTFFAPQDTSYQQGPIYSGTEADPTFTPGVYDLYKPNTAVTYTLTITAAVPEPATWGMMIMGFGAVGVALRRRRRGEGAAGPMQQALA